ncbi:MAG: ATP-dependent Clp protease ATP-binding subunit [Clostridia bacterium]|nr:ATP-dependent Clp protease ATP-binding subunit [Clostridia bacterium]
MKMQMCVKCRRRVAVVFITRMDKDGTVNEGLCLNCARELGIKPVNDMLEKMGVSEEDLERMSEDLRSALSDGEEPVGEDDGEDGGAPAIDLPKLFQNLGFPIPGKGNEAKGEGERPPRRERDATPKREKRKFLDTYCKNLTKQAAEGRLDKIVGRERELDRVIQILCRRQKNNPCLIGEPGVGKTAIAEALALRIVAGEVPYRLRDAEVYLVDLTALVAGTQFRGQFESRILGLISEVKAAGNIILVIDEVHNIVGAGESEGSMNAANILKPALSRGEIQVIGATTLKEYRKFIEKDSALERRFQPVTVQEPSVTETVDMLRGIKGYYEDFHGVRIPDETLRYAAEFSERYITDRFLPDKAIDLLDEAAARRALDTPELGKRRAAEEELAKIAKAKAALEGRPDEEDPKKNEGKYREIADLTVRELKLKEELAPLMEVCERVFLTVDDLARVIEVWTGIPATSINTSEFARLDRLEERISRRIIGQSAAVSAVARAIKRKRAGVSVRRAPISFIFAGPTGVGKTQLVKVLAEDLFSQPDTLIRLDMSEYMEKHSVSKLIGAPPGYVGFDEAGQLTEKIRRRPYSVVLFDEIEKAHPDVLNILLQVLDDGKLTDAMGRVVNFENTLIVMTTNAGSERASAISGFSESQELQDKERTERALSSFLRPEFLNRIDEIITFRPLSREDFAAIARLQIAELSDVLASHGIRLSVDEAAYRVIAEESYSEKYGARNMRRYLEGRVEDVLAEKIIARYEDKVTEAAIAVSPAGELSITCM